MEGNEKQLKGNGCFNSFMIAGILFLIFMIWGGFPKWEYETGVVIAKYPDYRLVIEGDHWHDVGFSRGLSDRQIYTHIEVGDTIEYCAGHGRFIFPKHAGLYRFDTSICQFRN